MPTTLFQNSKHPVHIDSDTEVGYNSPSAIGLALSFVLMMVGGLGLVWPTFLSLNLSIMHCLVLAGSGAISAYAVITQDKRKTFLIYISLAVFFFLHTVLGWLLGGSGEPRFAFYTHEQLDRLAPGFLELATIDHVVHGVLGLLFLTEAFVWKEWLKGSARHDAQKKALLKVAKYAVILFIVLTVFVVTDQIQRSPQFLNN